MRHFYVFVSIFISHITLGQIYTESFENSWTGSPAAPTGWSQVAGQTGSGAGTDIAWEQCVFNTGWTCSNAGTNPSTVPDGSAVAHYYNNLSQTGQTDTLKTLTIDLSSTVNPYISFYYNYWMGTTILKVLASADGTSNWIDITGGGIGQTSFNWYQFTYNLGAFKTSTMKIAFVVVAENNSNDVWLDNIIVGDAPSALSGIYTIDNTLPTAATNFTSFSDAINTLNQSGLSGPVTFNVSANQLFVEATPLITASGTATNTITFQKSGIGANPIISSAGIIQTTEAGIYVWGGDYFTFDGIDVVAISSLLDVGYYFCNASSTNGCKYITLKNCKIIMKKPGGMSASAANGAGTPTASSGANSYIVFQNITAEGGRNGLGLSATSAFPSEGCSITECTIGADVANDIGNNTLTVSGITALYCKNIIIADNHIRNLFGGGNSTTGIYTIHMGTNSIIRNNQIHSIKVTSTSSSDQCIGIFSSGYSLLDTMTISNNFIYDLTHNIASPSATASSIKAISLNASSVGINKLFFNTVYFNGGSIAGSSVVYSFGGNNIIQNNILYNASPSGATSKRYLIRYTGSVSTSNNNILLNVAGTNNFIGYSTGDKATLANWQASSGTPDLNSYSIDPMFVSNTDLHFTNKAMNNLGVPIAGITNDFDGETRNVTTPDIGADEFDDILLLDPTFNPANGSTDVNVTTDITVSYPEDIRLIDNSAITDLNVSSIISFKDAALNDIPYTATWNEIDNVITINPTTDLAVLTEYSVTITGIEDFWENVATHSTTFTTVSIVTDVTISMTSGTNPSCQNDLITFTASPYNGGTSPSYQWMINGNIVGSNSDVFTTSSLADNDTVNCIITSNDPGVIYTDAISNSIVVDVISSTFRDTSAVVCGSFSWHGNTYYSSDTAIFILTNAAGCDSVITLYLTVINIADQSVSAANTSFCDNGATTIDLAASQSDINYYLRNNSNNSHIDTIIGTGSAISFPVNVSSTTTYNVLAERINTSGALDFNGTNQYVLVPSSAELTITSSITMEAMVYIPTNFTGIRTIMNKSGVAGYGLGLGSAFNDKVINIYLGSAFARLTTPANAFTEGQWHHIAATFNDATNQLAIYVNGVLSASGSFTGTYSGNNGSLTIGATNSGTANFFKGGIDEVRIWNFARNQSEIQSSMNADLFGTETGLVAYYEFDEISGSSVFDNAANNDGSTNNMTDLNRIKRNTLICTKELTEKPSITINQTYINYDVASICEGESYVFGSQTLTTAGDYSETFTSVNGCDSVVTLSLFVNPVFNTSDVTSICNGDSYIFGTQTLTNPGFYNETFISEFGCDSIVNLELIVNNSNSGTEIQTSCNSYTWIDGITYTSSTNSPTFTLTNVLGCDSVVTLDLTINNSNTGDTTAVACYSFDWYGTTYTSSTTATHTFVNAVGCDSIVTLNLTINNSSSGIDVQTACESYTWIDGNSYTISNNTATFTLTNSEGCDSIVTLNLTIYNGTFGIDVVSACESYTWIDGITYTSSTNSPTFILINSNGCDSVVTLDLTIHSPIIVNIGEDQPLCYEIMQVKTLDAGNSGMSYLWSNGSTAQTFVADALLLGLGIHTIGVTVTDGICTSTDEIVLDVDICSGIVAVKEQMNISMYPNPTKGILNISIEGLNSEATLSIMNVTGETILTEILSSETTTKQIDFSSLPKGIYAVKLTTVDVVKVSRIVIQK